jgi:peptidoglycan-associated lipoprotein
MKSPRPSTTLSLLVLTALAASGCTAQPVATKTALNIAAPEHPADSPGDLFVHDDHLETVFFESAKAEPDAKALQVMKGNVDWLKLNMPLHIEIAGYSDGLGTPEQNLRMGQRRAAALRDYYVTMGIPRSRISTITLGQEEPVCLEQTEECHAKNRRADTRIDNKTLASR